MRDLNDDDGRRYSPRAFRRGAEQAIFNSWPTFSTGPKSGICTSGGYKFFLDLHSEEAVNISALLETAAESDIDDPGGPPTAPRDKNRDKAMGAVRRLLKRPTKVGHPPTIAFGRPRWGGFPLSRPNPRIPLKPPQ